MFFGKAAAFFAAAFLMLAASSCRTVENNHLSCADFAVYLQSKGLEVETIQPLATLFGSSDALAVQIAGRQIGIYKYNINVRKQADELAVHRRNGFVCLNAQKYPALFNGSFMIVGCEINPRKKELVKAVDSF